MRRGYTRNSGHSTQLERIRVEYVSKRGRRPKCGDHIVAIRKGLAAGRTVAEIAAEIGTSRSTLHNFIKKFRLVRNRRQSALRAGSALA